MYVYIRGVRHSSKSAVPILEVCRGPECFCCPDDNSVHVVLTFIYFARNKSWSWTDKSVAIALTQLCLDQAPGD